MVNVDKECVLVLRAKAGDEAALNELIVLLYPQLVSALRRKIGSDAEDLAQDILFQVVQKLDTLKNPRALRGWLKVMTFRMMYNFLNRVKRDTPYGFIDSTIQDDPHQALMQKETVKHVRKMINQLSKTYPKGDRDKKILLDYMKGKQMKQLAKKYELPEGTVKRAIHETKKKLALVL